jgi:sugar lactone lactonase YvrE
VIRQLEAELVDDAGAVLGEGPAWDDRTSELVWVDILSGMVHVYDDQGRPWTAYDVGVHVGSALPSADGGWLLFTADGFAFLDRDGSVRPLLDVVADRPELRGNDAKCDPWGQALAGTMRYDEAPGSGALYRLEAGPPEGRSRRTLHTRTLLSGVGLSNGLGWSPDGRWLYFVDSLSGAVVRHRYAPEGGLGPGDQLALIDPAAGVPDGLCVDTEGCLWVAVYGGGAVHRFRPDGRLDSVVRVPVPLTTSVTFGGVDGARLFITTAGGSGQRDGSGRGGLWAVDPGIPGPPATPWLDPVRKATR